MNSTGNEDPPEETPIRPKTKAYASTQIGEIRLIYFAGILFWILLSWYFGFFPGEDWVEWFIFLVPIALFLVAWGSVQEISPDVEAFMYRTNVLTLGLLIALPLLNWVEDHHPERHNFIPIMATAIILSMLTLIDTWVPHQQLCWIKHIKSILQTIAIVLLIYGLYRYFVDPKFNELQKSSLKISEGVLVH